MTEEQRKRLKSFISDDFQKSDATLEQTTTANVGAFAVPLGGMIRRASPTAVATIEPAYPNPNYRPRRKLKRRSH